jgi:REP element-mobilizing transposase RayT
MTSHQYYYPPLLEGCYYHIYNRGNNGDNLFYQPRNYFYFLKQYDLYLSDYLETYAYCLLPNHFHLLVKVRDWDDLPANKQYLQHGSKHLSTPETIISELFRRFFSAYARAIKTQEERTGSLFQKNFKRKPVLSEAYFTNLVAYIHRNPQKHGISSDFKEYPYNSYNRMLMPQQTRLKKAEVIGWFGGINGFQVFHDTKHDEKQIDELIIEE